MHEYFPSYTPNTLLPFLNQYRTEERAGGWYRLTREILKLPDTPSLRDSTSDEKDAAPAKATKDKSAKTRRPQPLIKLVMRRLYSSFSFYVLVECDKMSAFL